MALRAIPDSLTPVYVNHVGRHGARFLSSSKYTTALLRYLENAESLKTITPAGRELMNLCSIVVSRTAGRWGALDSLGMAEQRGIASRLHMLTPGTVQGYENQRNLIICAPLRSVNGRVYPSADTPRQ